MRTRSYGGKYLVARPVSFVFLGRPFSSCFLKSDFLGCLGAGRQCCPQMVPWLTRPSTYESMSSCHRFFSDLTLDSHEKRKPG